MSDLILSLPHYHRHIAIYVVQIINMILGRMYVSFTGFPFYYKQNQNKVLYVNMENMDFLPPTAPSLVFAHETYRTNNAQ